MIAKGNTHGDGVKLAAYLVTGEHGERAELLDMRGFASSDIHTAFRDIENAKKATKADAAFFHVQIRGADGEGSKLSRAQWLEIANGCDAALGRGMARQGRAASLHINGASGDMHMHLAYDLIRQRPDGRLYVAKLGLFETRLQLYAREIEKKYGLRIASKRKAAALAPTVTPFAARSSTPLRSPTAARHSPPRYARKAWSLRRATGTIALLWSMQQADTTPSTSASPARRSRKSAHPLLPLPPSLRGFPTLTARSFRPSRRRRRCSARGSQHGKQQGRRARSYSTGNPPPHRHHPEKTTRAPAPPRAGRSPQSNHSARRRATSA